MLNEYEESIYDVKCEKFDKVINIPISLFESLKGKYFIGQTEPILVSNTSNAWAGLFNPNESGVNLYANVITISNFSNESLVAEIWFNTNFSDLGILSQKISSSNTAFEPKPANKVNIKYMQSTENIPNGGINVFDRIVPPNGTLVSEDDGKLIFSPCGNYSVLIKSASPNFSKVIVAFGWWEELIK